MHRTHPSSPRRSTGWPRAGSVALATVIQTWGSAPQPVGSQLVIDADGNFLGSVSGGCVEAEVITEAIEVIATAKPKALEFGVEDEKAWSVGLACGGAIRIFVEPLAARSGAPGDSVLPRLMGDVAARRKVALVTHLGSRRAKPCPCAGRCGTGSGPGAGRGVSPRPRRGVDARRRRDLHQRVQSDDPPDHRRRRACGAAAGRRWHAHSATR